MSSFSSSQVRIELTCFRVSCANLGWEIMYGFFYPPSMAETITFTSWVLIDLVLVYATIAFGPHEWRHAPLVAQNLGPMILAGSVLMVTMHWAFILSFADSFVACFWAGFGCQVLLSWASVAQLLSRGNTRGQSMTIW